MAALTCSAILAHYEIPPTIKEIQCRSASKIISDSRTSAGVPVGSTMLVLAYLLYRYLRAFVVFDTNVDGWARMLWGENTQAYFAGLAIPYIAVTVGTPLIVLGLDYLARVEEQTASARPPRVQGKGPRGHLAILTLSLTPTSVLAFTTPVHPGGGATARLHGRGERGRMAKDVKKGNLLKWDMFLTTTAKEAIPAIYLHASEFSKTARDWYWDNIPRSRRGALVVRVVSYVLGVLGILAPIISAIWVGDKEKLATTQFGVAAVAVAGLLQVGDRAFGWSTSWLRYVSAVTDMEKLTLKFELDWAGYCISKSGALDDADKKALLEIAVQFEMAIQNRQSEETASWNTEFTNGTAALNEMIASQKKALETQTEALKNGAIEVAITQATVPLKPVTLYLDGEKNEPFTGTSWAARTVSPGQHTVRVVLESETTKPEATKVAWVKAGTVASLEFKL